MVEMMISKDELHKTGGGVLLKGMERDALDVIEKLVVRAHADQTIALKIKSPMNLSYFGYNVPLPREAMDGVVGYLKFLGYGVEHTYNDYLIINWQPKQAA